MSVLTRRTAVVVFLAFAFTYFISALLRAITATLAPTLEAEFQLHARDLGLLAGGYFLGFALTQLGWPRWPCTKPAGRPSTTATRWRGPPARPATVRCASRQRAR